MLTARDDYWGGRAFVDSVEIEMGKSFREQKIALDLARRTQQRSLRIRRVIWFSKAAEIETSAPSGMDGAGFQPRHSVRRRRGIASRLWGSASIENR